MITTEVVSQSLLFDQSSKLPDKYHDPHCRPYEAQII